MRSGLLLWLTLIGLSASCATSAVRNRGAYTRVVVTNLEWSDATVRVHCRGNRRATFRVPSGETVEKRLYLGGCGGLAATARLLAHRHVRRSPTEYASLDGAYIDIRVLPNLDYVALAVYPER